MSAPAKVRAAVDRAARDAMLGYESTRPDRSNTSLAGVVEPGSTVVEAKSHLVVIQPVVLLLEPLHRQIEPAHVHGRGICRVADFKPEAADGNRVRTRRGHEIDREPVGRLYLDERARESSSPSSGLPQGH